MKIKLSATISLLGLLVGIASTTLYFHYFSDKLHSNSQSSNHDTADKPLYWVAPMDPNFQRDKPGKSPMGMDLVPVYANDNKSDSPGTITIEPEVINNIGVRTAIVQKSAMSEPVIALGLIQYNQDTLVHIHPRVEGWIEALYVKAEGEYVEKGDPLYALYSPELVNAQEEYLLALSRSNNNLVKAAKSRLSALQIPNKAIDELSKSRTIQQRIVFYAPQTGFIDNLNIREGFFVSPSITLMAIGALDEVWVNTQIMAGQTSLIAVDMPVDIELEYFPNTAFNGKIDYIYPTLDANNRTLRARVRVKNPDYLLKPNMFARVIIDTTSLDAQAAAKMLLVPAQAVIRTGLQNRVVLALGQGRFKSVEVKIGRIFANHIEITQGLEEYDEIVVSAQFLLDSESSVSSDFLRMQAPDQHSMGASSSQEQQKNQRDMSSHGAMNHDKSLASSPQNTAAAIRSQWTQATIIDLMLDERKLTLEHGELSEWGMPAMTMDFMVASDIDMSELSTNMQIHVQIIKTDSPMFTVNTIHIMGNGEMKNPMDHSEAVKMPRAKTGGKP
jgi:Cu(I)/Ag(I) efflux system membrane fusion protein